MNLRNSLTAILGSTGLVVFLACGGGGGGNPPPPPPTYATTLAYTDPASGTYQVKKNAALTTSTHLVLDVVGSGAPSGAALAFSLTTDTTRTAWAKVGAADPQFVQNGVVLSLGSAPQAIKGSASGASLLAAVGQKGLGASLPLNGVLASVALDLKSAAAKGSVGLAQTKAQVLLADGSIANITLTFGSLSAN